MARATSSLPVPVSPVISTVLFVSATQLGALDDVLHGAAAADDAVVIELLVALAEQVAVFGAQPLMLERAADDDQQLVDLERLLQVVEGAELHRFDGALDRGVRGHHQDLRPLAFGRRRRRSSRIRSRPVSSGIRLSTTSRSNERSASRRCASRGLVGLDHVVAVVAQRPAERLQDLLLVVDEQNGAARMPSVRRSPVRAAVRRSRSTGSSMRISVPCAGRAGDGDRAAQAFDDVLGDRRGRGRCRRAWS